MIELLNCDCLDGEVFRKLDNLDQYLFSNKGRVYSFFRNRLLNPVKLKSGYLVITHNKKALTLHRIVAKLFIENPNCYPCVNHIDYDKTNNNDWNLEWCTYSHNIKHGYMSGDHSGIKKIKCTSIIDGSSRVYASARAAEVDGFQNQLISKCCKGFRKTHKDHTFCYA